jgi:catalase
MLMWAMSDRAIPRSYRMMQGFGVHTFRLVNLDGASRFVKFHWNPVLGTHSLDWDEAVKISGADPDFHRRDLWEAIEAGVFPEYELGMQIFTEKQAEGFSFDVLDPTKIVPEELVPVTPVGRMVLNRNPDNFFAETEQVAFCAAHIVPGLDFSNDPLLAGRIHSYVDTQISRLGGPNFHEIPINAPLAQAHNNQRDGMHRQAPLPHEGLVQRAVAAESRPRRSAAAPRGETARQDGDRCRARRAAGGSDPMSAAATWRKSEMNSGNSLSARLASLAPRRRGRRPQE